MLAMTSGTITGSDANDALGRLVSTLKEGRSVTLLVSVELLRSPLARETLQQLGNLLQLLRLAGKEPSLQFLFDRANQMGAWDMGVLPGVLPGLGPVADEATRTEFARSWGAEIPREPGADFDAMLELCVNGRMGVLYVVGSGPADVLSRPGVRRARTRYRQSSDRAGRVSDRYGGTGRRRAAAAGYGEESGTLHQHEGRTRRFENSANRLLTPGAIWRSSTLSQHFGSSRCSHRPRPPSSTR